MSRPYRVIPEEAVFDYLRGDSLKEIAERYGVYKQGVHNFLIRHYVPMRQHGRPRVAPAPPKPEVVFVPVIPPFRSGLCACLNRGYFILAGVRSPCPRCALRKKQMKD